MATVKRSGRGSSVIRAAVLSGVCAAAAASIACRQEPAAAPEVSRPGGVPAAPGKFSDTTELLQAIEGGTFDKEVDQDLAALEPPAPETITFDSGTQVPADQMTKLREFTRALTSDSRLKVDLVGCSDPAGSAALKRKISQARAEAVAKVLDAHGLPGGRIGKVVGRGADCEIQERVVVATPYFADETDTAAHPG